MYIEEETTAQLYRDDFTSHQKDPVMSGFVSRCSVGMGILSCNYFLSGHRPGWKELTFWRFLGIWDFLRFLHNGAMKRRYHQAAHILRIWCKCICQSSALKASFCGKTMCIKIVLLLNNESLNLVNPILTRNVTEKYFLGAAKEGMFNYSYGNFWVFHSSTFLTCKQQRVELSGSLLCIYRTCESPLFWCLNPPKQGLFQSKQGSLLGSRMKHKPLTKDPGTLN